MAKIKHIAIATQDPDKTAGFYKQVFGLRGMGKLNSDAAEGYYLSDGHINLAILKFKNEVVAGKEFGTDYFGIHHIGFHVDDASATDAKLRNANSFPRDEINTALHSRTKQGNCGRNVELKYNAHGGVMIDISQSGWVGTDSDCSLLYCVCGMGHDPAPGRSGPSNCGKPTRARLNHRLPDHLR